MVADAMGLILADTDGAAMGELTKPRAMAALPFAGRYRIIDFILSNLVNSGIISVGVLTSNKYRSLMDHLGSGAAWDLSRKNKGLFILPPFVTSEAHGRYSDADGFLGVMDFFRMNSSKYVIVTESNFIFKTTFNEIIRVHEESGADVTIMYNRDEDYLDEKTMYLDADDGGRVKNLYINSEIRMTDKVSMDVFVIKRELLLDLLWQAISRGDAEVSIKDLLHKNQKLRIRGFEFKGYCLRINSIESYFAASMEILKYDVRKQLFWGTNKIFTKVKDEAPAIYSEDCNVGNSLISDGCKVYGDVADSVLFRSVTVSPKASLKNCILMQGVHISEGCVLENVIIDKNSILRPGIKLIGQPNYPVIIGKGAVV